MARVHKSYCRNCPSVCGLIVKAENNRILEIRGDGDHPLTGGYFCIKGLASMDLHNGEDRLVAPLARSADGTMREIGVEEALDEVHAKLEAIVARHGARSVAMYYGTGANNNSICHSAMKGWFDLVGSPYVFSSMTLDQSAKWVTAARMGIFATFKYSAIDADVIMEVGVNPAVSHMSSTIPMTNPMKSLRDAQARGLKLIVVDPRRTETARRAALHLQIKPGEDATLFAGLIHIVLQNGWHDAGFCERFLQPLDALRAAVAPFTPDYVADRTSVPQELLIRAAEMFTQADRKSAASGTGPNMATASNVAEHMLEAFNAICGGYRRAGDVIRNVQPLFGGHATHEMVIGPYRPWETGQRLRTADIGPMFGEYPTALLPAEILGTGEDKIRALIVAGGNPLKSIADPVRTTRAFKELELLVTLDLRPTDTTALSDYVFATSLPYERFDYTGMYDSLYSRSFAQVATPILERPPGVIDDWEFFWGLARRMGRPLELKKPTFGASHDQIPGPVLTLDPDRKPTTEEIVRWMTSHHLVDYDQLIANPQGVLLDQLVLIEPAAADDGARLDPCPPDVAAELADVLASPETNGAFPFRLTARRLLESMNSAYSNASKTRGRYPVNPVFMNPDDMDEIGIENGASVEVASEHGALFATARRDPTMGRGTVAITHGWGVVDPAADPEGAQGAFIGRLVSLDDHIQSINYMPRQSAIPVAVRPHPHS